MTADEMTGCSARTGAPAAPRTGDPAVCGGRVPTDDSRRFLTALGRGVGGEGRRLAGCAEQGQDGWTFNHGDGSKKVAERGHGSGTGWWVAARAQSGSAKAREGARRRVLRVEETRTLARRGATRGRCVERVRDDPLGDSTEPHGWGTECVRGAGAKTGGQGVADRTARVDREAVGRGSGGCFVGSAAKGGQRSPNKDAVRGRKSQEDGDTAGADGATSMACADLTASVRGYGSRHGRCAGGACNSARSREGSLRIGRTERRTARRRGSTRWRTRRSTARRSPHGTSGGTRWRATGPRSTPGGLGSRAPPSSGSRIGFGRRGSGYRASPTRCPSRRCEARPIGARRRDASQSMRSTGRASRSGWSGAPDSHSSTTRGRAPARSRRKAPVCPRESVRLGDSNAGHSTPIRARGARARGLPTPCTQARRPQMAGVHSAWRRGVWRGPGSRTRPSTGSASTAPFGAIRAGDVGSGSASSSGPCGQA